MAASSFWISDFLFSDELGVPKAKGWLAVAPKLDVTAGAGVLVTVGLEDDTAEDDNPAVEFAVVENANEGVAVVGGLELLLVFVAFSPALPNPPVHAPVKLKPPGEVVEIELDDVVFVLQILYMQKCVMLSLKINF